MKKKSVLVTSFLSLGAAGACAQATPAPAAPRARWSADGERQPHHQRTSSAARISGNTDRFRRRSRAASTGRRSGFYVGNWNSNVDASATRRLEMDFYGGYKGEITKEFGFDVGILQYYYPQKDKVVSFDTTELYGALTWTFLTLKYSHTISSDYFGFGELQQMAASTTAARSAEAAARTPATSS